MSAVDLFSFPGFNGFSRNKPDELRTDSEVMDKLPPDFGVGLQTGVEIGGGMPSV